MQHGINRRMSGLPGCPAGNCMDVSSSPWGANMTVRPIRVFSDPSLRNVAEPVTEFDRPLRDLVKSLTVTMRAGSGRAGLAAPQIGAPVRVIAYDLDGKAGHIVNPRLELSRQ